jgi:hypothetical protein
MAIPNSGSPIIQSCSCSLRCCSASIEQLLVELDVRIAQDRPMLADVQRVVLSAKRMDRLSGREHLVLLTDQIHLGDDAFAHWLQSAGIQYLNELLCRDRDP